MDASRQYGTSIDLIRADHVKRYQFAANKIPRKWSVLDLACGCGYGSRILMDAGLNVTGMDISREAIDYAREHYAGPSYFVTQAETIRNLQVDALVCFETLEHLKEPSQVLQNIHARKVIASVPNQELYAFDPQKFKDDDYPHQRHYTPGQFEELLIMGGYRVVERHCQKDKSGDILPGTDGIFLIYVANR